jgi:hypothetical protein
MLACLCACGVEPPAFISVQAPTRTHDEVGPYRVEAWVETERGLRFLALRLSDEPPQYTERRATRIEREDGAELWIDELPGLPVGSVYRFHLVAVDNAGKKISYPAGAPDEQLEIEIVPP